MKLSCRSAGSSYRTGIKSSIPAAISTQGGEATGNNWLSIQSTKVPGRSTSVTWSGIADLQSELLEEIVTLVIYEDEGREVLDTDLPDSLHSELWIFNAFDASDAAL